ncbi:hypothetical protein GGS21DRAFT_509855 [Xylaria nigripes]|nr:hypothetical protein GGS21DRAFT_509855 [Xylaria nigripes]
MLYFVPIIVFVLVFLLFLGGGLLGRKIIRLRRARYVVSDQFMFCWSQVCLLACLLTWVEGLGGSKKAQVYTTISRFLRARNWKRDVLMDGCETSDRR